MIDRINTKIVLLGTLIGGAISSMVKSGSESPMPPRIPGEASPPAININEWGQWFGVDAHSLDYVYQTVTVPGAVLLYHWLFSFIFAFVYIALSAYWPKVRLWYGAAYGLAITFVMHGLIIPALGFRNPAYLNGETGWLWNLNGYELWSELIGHVCWSVSIEVSLIAVLACFSKPIFGNWYESN
ncbi:YagU family protein [Vibrio campbellii]|nr:DUF1440 domain-containing protein [Vibrio campbellii]